MVGFETYLDTSPPFCSNPGCVLHVRVGSPGVHGVGNWARLSDGRILGRGIYYGLYLCDRCAREWGPVPVALQSTPA